MAIIALIFCWAHWTFERCLWIILPVTAQHLASYPAKKWWTVMLFFSLTPAFEKISLFYLCCIFPIRICIFPSIWKCLGFYIQILCVLAWKKMYSFINDNQGWCIGSTRPDWKTYQRYCRGRDGRLDEEEEVECLVEGNNLGHNQEIKNSSYQ